jgi:hypothetical protein
MKINTKARSHEDTKDEGELLRALAPWSLRGSLLSSLSHLRLLAEVRWQVLRNALRTPRNKLDLAAQVLLGLIGAIIGLGLGLAITGLVYSMLLKHRSVAVGLALWFVFIFWQIGPLATEGGSPALSFSEIARYPISFQLYALLYTAYGLLDPAALLSLLWLACIWLGIALGAPQWALPAAFLFAAFALVNVLLNRVLFGFLQTLMRTRRGRERVGGALLCLLILSQFAILLLPLFRAHKERVIARAGAVIRWFPPTLAFGALEAAKPLPRDRAQGGTPAPPGGWNLAVAPLAALALYGAGAAWLLRRQLWRTYLGEITAESAAPAGAVQAEPGWKLPLLDEAMSAAIEKEARYALRDPRTLVPFAIPPLMAITAALGSQVARQGLAGGREFRLSTAYLVILGYAALTLGQLAYNTLCYESHGLDRWLMAPLDLRRLFLAKNAVLGTALLLNFLLVTGFIAAGSSFANQQGARAALAGGLPAGQIAIAAGGFAFAALVMLAAGNLFSVWFPMRIEYGTMSGKKAPAIGILLGVVAQAGISGAIALVIYGSGRWGLERLQPLAFGFLMLLGLKLYLSSLAYAAAYLGRHSEDISSALK